MDSTLIAEKIVQCFNIYVVKYRERFYEIIEKNPGYGIRRIKAELSDTHQVDIGRDTLGKLLKLWGLGLKRKIKKRKPNLIQKILIALADRTIY